MGLISCRMEAWVGFHPEFRGFGSCESYIMEKFRLRDGRVLCCPWLRCNHRFPRAEQLSYPIVREDRIRNYLIGFKELGLGLQQVLDHFNTSRPDQRPEKPKNPARSMSEVAVVGDLAYGGVTMRGRTLSHELS